MIDLVLIVGTVCFAAGVFRLDASLGLEPAIQMLAGMGLLGLGIVFSRESVLVKMIAEMLTK